jgi:pimeloyl-ACP methyl ester carboxylesterase
MADADLRDLLPYIAVPTLLICGELDARSPLAVARQCFAVSSYVVLSPC